MPNLDLTRSELKVLKKLLDVHADDTPDEHYSAADFDSLRNKVVPIAKMTNRPISVVLIHQNMGKSSEGDYTFVSDLIADNEHDMEALENIARGLNEMRNGKGCVNIGSGGSTGDLWMTYYW
jgi:hypothetical protein